MKKILVANRGEIALRIMRSVREMGISTVAVYSDADRLSPYVQYADEAVHIGPPPSSESYLLGDKIIDAAKKLGADGIHPGYGFLSENAGFARAVGEAGIIFIGPDPGSIEVMGSKLAAKAAVAQYNIPMVPGTEHAIDNVEEAREIGNKTGYPILIKASAGGGGKGMRVVNGPDELEEQMKRAISEAESAFGDGSVFIEKYVKSPRHIEIQILADNHGNIRYLFERECSIQRRHQKVIEEAPSANLSPELRKAMGESAVNVTKSCNYKGAGTVEYLMDADRNYYFLEMNTRLQVEHPVTEMITGLDLVKEQVKIARGERLGFEQDDLKINGHSIELRIYAEDPATDFLPDTGRLEHYKLPQGPGIRVDDGFEEGMEIPVYYDPMISKLIVHARDRDEAIGKMLRAVRDYKISGVKNTLPFGEFVMKHPEFKSGKYDTHFVPDFFKASELSNEYIEEMEIAALLATLKVSNSKFNGQTENHQYKENSNWRKNRINY